MNQTSTPLLEIDAACLRHSKDREKIADIVSTMEAQIAGIKRAHLSALRQAVGKAGQSHAQLKALLEAHPESFERPKTQVFHGLKVGYRKGTGGIVIDDPERTVALIEKHFDEGMAATLIQITKAPVKKAIEQLEVAALKKIGCAVKDTGEEIVIKPVDGEVDKVVNALLKEATADAADAGGREAA